MNRVSTRPRAAQAVQSVGDLRRRAALSQPIAEALTHAGALDELGGVEAGVRTRPDLLLEVSERWSGLTRHRVPDPAAPRQLELLEPEPSPGLREYRPSERVRAELEVLGLEVSRHVVSFYDDLLDVLGVTRAVDLLGRRNGERVRVGGVKVATQTPPVKSGQRIVFLSLDDATGVTDSTFFESVHDRCAWTVFHTWLLVVEGAVHRTGARGVSLNAHAAWDLRRLMHAWRGGWLDQALRERRGPSGVPLDGRAGGDFVDGAPSEQTRGAPGRSGLRLDQTGEADHVTLAARLRAPRTSPYGVTRVPSKPAAAPDEPGAPSRTGPNAATWADPADRHPGVEPGDVSRLARTDPRRPDHALDENGAADPPRKLWHASGGSAGR